MQIAIALFPQFTALDAIGPYEVFSRLPNAEVVTVGDRTGLVRTDTSMLAVQVERTYAEVSEPDVVVVPGGVGQNHHRAGSALHTWLQKVDVTSTWTVSACTGALILASAGLLAGRSAATHWLAHDELASFGAAPSGDRVVFDGKYVTAAGVSAGIDMALALAARIAGEHTAQAIQLGIEYDPAPPFNAGSPRTAPEPVVERLRAAKHAIV